MFFPPQFLDDIRAKIPVSQVVSRRVKLTRRGREFVGLSPFKTEKTPSFTVNDQKQFYHCFATGEHGDIFTFVMKTEGLSFKEAVERLAGEANVPIPKSSPEAIKTAKVRDHLREIMSASAAFFQKHYLEANGRIARDYVQKRGLTQAQLSKFQIGYAPGSRSALKMHLTKLGFSINDMIKSGMLIGGEDIKEPYDRFRHRLMFPITDLKGQVIAFGGRALDEDQPAKYLNSPETPLFHKGHQLYNSFQARKPAYDEGAVIVAEGYMDVIAMDGAGFENAVAPLGTALTSEQLALLWRMAREPVLCFDGDGAGKKAAFRAVETALPLLKPGYSLKFAMLPDGQDPDDLLKEKGPDALRQLIDGAKPLSQMLWQKEFLTGDWDTPEQRAALEKQLMDGVNQIADTVVQSHYRRDMKSRLWNYFKPNGKGAAGSGRNTGAKGQWNKQRFGQVSSASPALIDSPLVRKDESAEGSEREILLCLTLLNHPWLLENHDETLMRLKFANKDCETIVLAALDARILYNPLDMPRLDAHLTKLGYQGLVEKLRTKITHRGNKFVDVDAKPAMVEESWKALLSRHLRAQTLFDELQVALVAFDQEGSDDNYERIKILNEAINQCY